ncbi:MAG: hypothetical protein DRN35_02770 [Thermoplasmata archaeon]|mgnify:FL=1|nr:MAG: hypothetical protein DRN35_02770 [Thermoplasmata archaeon]RLF72313.1 MAG: hypothetical protein DRN40_00540 [Thermoplasmata archaeon]
MKRAVKNLQIFLGLLIVLSSIGFMVPSADEKKEAAAIGPASVTLQLDEGKRTAQVAPGQSGIVTFSGSVNAIVPWQPNVQQCVVTLQGSTDAGWPVTISPSTVIFTRQDTKAKPFIATVKVPPETPYLQSGTVIIQGRWSYVPGAIGGPVNPVTGIIDIDQFYRFTLNVKSPYVQVRPGSTLNFDIKIRNDGNGADVLSLRILNYDKLSKKDWVVQLGNPRIRVQSNQEEVVTLSIATEQRIYPWVNEVTTIQIELISVQAQELGELSLPVEYALFVRERGVATPGFDPMFLIFILGTLAILFVNRERKRS